MSKLTPDTLKYDANGLIPAIVQDAATREVLMMAWMNAASVQMTLDKGETVFWSRSRQEIWHKGATSGNVQHVRDIRYDCDGDTLLILVDPAGPACHTGARSCFYRTMTETADSPAPASILHTLSALIEDRKVNQPEGSYTVTLLNNENKAAQKVGEEGVEVVIAALNQTKERLVEESADLLYHLLVVLAQKDVKLADVERELEKRK